MPPAYSASGTVRRESLGNKRVTPDNLFNSSSYNTSELREELPRQLLGR